MTEIDLTNYRDLVRAHAEVERRLDANAKDREILMRARDQVRDALSYIFGDATDGVLDGRVVLRRRPTEQFASARFAKEHPDLAKQFEMAKVRYVTDTEALSKAEPEIYAQYTTVRWYGETE